MVLLKYLKPSGKKEAVSVGTLPDPEGPLLQLIPSSLIIVANKDVAQVLSQNQEDGVKKSTSGRGKYQHYTSKERVEIGKRAAELV